MKFLTFNFQAVPYISISHIPVTIHRTPYTLSNLWWTTLLYLNLKSYRLKNRFLFHTVEKQHFVFYGTRTFMYNSCVLYMFQHHSYILHLAYMYIKHTQDTRDISTTLCRSFSSSSSVFSVSVFWSAKDLPLTYTILQTPYSIPHSQIYVQMYICVPNSMCTMYNVQI